MLLKLAARRSVAKQRQIQFRESIHHRSQQVDALFARDATAKDEERTAAALAKAVAHRRRTTRWMEELGVNAARPEHQSFHATFAHLVQRGAGGGHIDDRLVVHPRGKLPDQWGDGAKAVTGGIGGDVCMIRSDQRGADAPRLAQSEQAQRSRVEAVDQIRLEGVDLRFDRRQRGTYLDRRVHRQGHAWQAHHTGAGKLLRSAGRGEEHRLHAAIF